MYCNNLGTTGAPKPEIASQPGVAGKPAVIILNEFKKRIH